MTQIIPNAPTPTHLPKVSFSPSSPKSVTSTSVNIPTKTDHTKWVYSFSAGNADGTGTMKSLLGGKGAGLAAMSLLSLPVPPGFTLVTSLCNYFSLNNQTYPPNVKDQVAENIVSLENLTGRTFGNESKPLLLSVRSGAPISMPGMMDTVLNLGLNDKTVIGLAKETCNERFALDSYRRFIQMFGNVVMGIDMGLFEKVLHTKKERYGCKTDIDLTSEHLQAIIEEYKEIFKTQTGLDFIQDVDTQLWFAVNAVFKSWNNDRAITYRKLNNIPNDIGTAVTVQCMVFGNMGNTSATGVVFTRNPSDGTNEFYGEYLVNAQGEDVVAGIRTPKNIQLMQSEPEMGEMYLELTRFRTILEGHFKDVQDIEFTVQQGKLYILQTRNAKRSATAAVKIAVDMVAEEILTEQEALLRIDPHSVSQLLHPAIDPTGKKIVITKGLPASPGAASGMLCFSAADTDEMSQRGNVILCTEETSPEDVHGMHISKGILTKRGGMTSHAAVVARGMGTPAVTGAGNINIDLNKKQLTIIGNDELLLKEGDIITIDGSTGEVMNGLMKTIDPDLSLEFETLMQWADNTKKLDILTNAETPLDVQRAKRFGAKGVGLCRTEHMFFQSDRITIMREMILANNADNRRKALDKLIPFQREDFKQIFSIMNGYPVTIRFLDPPLHEFLPEKEEEIDQIVKSSGMDKDVIKKKLNGMKEANPMLGLRGCRVGIVYPEIYLMQSRASLEAAIQVAEESKIEVEVDLMIPFISTEEEIKIIKKQIDELAEKLLPKDKRLVKYRVGTMIELPRAALQAGAIAKHAQFFSFGTNDLTQTCFGLSRDDASSFIDHYENIGVIDKDPFVSLDTDGVGELIKIAVERGVKTRSDLKLCLCGEQGGDPESVKFCHDVGLHAVSCSPFLVPVARLAAAQAALFDQ
uniref:Pyruvate, phosphate dikinase n=1 Tax=Melanothamnus japonicus TaxID=2608613 RepID=A0A097IU37_9FLOR|nr:pyruvate orthophosphate dikinase [Melanothamnus japonicus]